MNLLSRIAAFEPTTYAEGSYEMTPADFIDGCFIRTDAVSGRQYGTGELRSGGMDTVPLFVPLCKGCDRLIVDDLCPDCCLYFSGDAA
jgi:hypothetical protein